MTEWISIKQLPDEYQDVNIYIPKNNDNYYKGIYTAYYIKSYKNNIEWKIKHEVSGNDFDEDKPNPTHWMPLPEEPK